MKTLNKQQILLLHSALIEKSGGSDGIRDDVAAGDLDRSDLLVWLQDHIE